MSNDQFRYDRQQEDICDFCQASPYVDCAVDCPSNWSAFGRDLPDSLRGVITTELLKQAEYIYERKQMDWYGKMLLDRIDNVMKDWPVLINFLKVLDDLNYFDNTADLIDYLHTPKTKENLFSIWSEMGMPQVSGTQSYVNFKNYLNNKEDNGRTDKPKK